jgi:hypothetical protein
LQNWLPPLDKSPPGFNGISLMVIPARTKVCFLWGATAVLVELCGVAVRLSRWPAPAVGLPAFGHTVNAVPVIEQLPFSSSPRINFLLSSRGT